MWQILSKLLFVMIIVLAVPTALILVSQNAVPGDQTYSIKRGMENGLGKALSLNPVTKAYFKTDLSKRRFTETVVLLKRNNADQTTANTSLRELLTTTANASADIKNVSDPNLKKTLSNNLAKQIATYRQNLAVVAKETHQVIPTPIPTGAQQPTPTPTTTRAVTPIPTGGGTIIPTTTRAVTPIPTGGGTIIPTVTAACTISSPVEGLLCGGSAGVTLHPITDLFTVSITTNSCTGAQNISITSTINLPVDCTDAIRTAFIDCKVGNMPACDAVLKAITPPSDSGAGAGGSSFNASSANPTPTTTVASGGGGGDFNASGEGGDFNVMGGEGPELNPIPTPTPTPSPTPKILSLSGRVTSIKTPPFTIGNAITFTASANDTHNPSWLSSGKLYVTLGNGGVMSQAECGAGHALEGGGIWCKISEVALSGNDATFEGSWTPTKEGDYFTAVNIYTNVEIGLQTGPRLWCAGNPWCIYDGMTTCPLRSSCVACPGENYCGYGSYRNFTVSPAQ